MSDKHDKGEEPVDPLPPIIAELDQALAMAGLLARAMRGYYDAFVAEGFTEKQALYLAARHLKPGPEEPPT